MSICQWVIMFYISYLNMSEGYNNMCQWKIFVIFKCISLFDIVVNLSYSSISMTHYYKIYIPLFEYLNQKVWRRWKRNSNVTLKMYTSLCKICPSCHNQYDLSINSKTRYSCSWFTFSNANKIFVLLVSSMLLTRSFSLLHNQYYNYINISKNTLIIYYWCNEKQQ